MPPEPVEPPVGPVQPPNLAIDKQAAKQRVRAGQRLRFRLTVCNRGTGTVRNVQVCDRLPRGLLLARHGRVSPRRRVCFTIRRLAPRAARAYRVVTRAAELPIPMSVRNVATARPVGGVTIPGPIGERTVVGRVSDAVRMRVLPSKAAPRRGCGSVVGC